MNQTILFTASLALATAFAANAGVLENGSWSASECGAMPEPPVIDSSSVDAFNRSIGTINAWQEQIQVYHDCMVKEANADGATINQAATAEQKRINEAVEKVNAEAVAGKQKVEQGAPSPTPSLSPPPASMPGGQVY